jgi:hypothetical protein
MRDFVYGKDVVISAFKGDDYYPFACAEEVRINVKTELLPASAPGSGLWEEVRPSGRNSWAASLTGVTVLKDDNDTLWFPWELFKAQIRSSGLQVKFDFIDKNGFTKYATGFVYIPNSEINGVVGDGEFSRFTVEFVGSGPLDVEGLIIDPTNDKEVKHKFFIATEGQNVFADNALIGLSGTDVLQVSREGDDKYSIITTGLPNDRQVLFNSGGGNITFEIPCIAGEYIHVLFKD